MNTPRVTTGRVSDEPVFGPRDAKSPTSREYAIQTVRSLSRYVEALLCDETRVREELDRIERYEHWAILGYETKAEMLQAEVLVRLRHQSLPAETVEATTRRLFATDDPKPAPLAACHADVLAELVDADELLDELKASGVRVEASGDRLRLSPASKLDEALVARVRPHKPAILALLASRPTRPDATETWLKVVDRLAAEHDVPPETLVELKAATAKWR